LTAVEKGGGGKESAGEGGGETKKNGTSSCHPAECHDTIET